MKPIEATVVAILGYIDKIEFKWIKKEYLARK